MNVVKCDCYEGWNSEFCVFFNIVTVPTLIYMPANSDVFYKNTSVRTFGDLEEWVLKDGHKTTKKPFNLSKPPSLFKEHVMPKAEGLWDKMKGFKNSFLQ